MLYKLISAINCCASVTDIVSMLSINLNIFAVFTQIKGYNAFILKFCYSIRNIIWYKRINCDILFIYVF